MYCVYWSETTLAHTPEQIEAWKSMTGETLDPTATRTEARRQVFRADQLVLALGVCEELRKRRREGAPLSMICMASEDANQVGQQGVDSIVEGKTPDGHTYDWKKRR